MRTRVGLWIDHRNTIAVAREYRTKGIGKKLYEKAKEWFILKSVNRMEVRILKSNPISPYFWKKVGLTPYMEVKYYGLSR